MIFFVHKIESEVKFGGLLNYKYNEFSHKFLFFFIVELFIFDDLFNESVNDQQKRLWVEVIDKYCFVMLKRNQPQISISLHFIFKFFT